MGTSPSIIFIIMGIIATNSIFLLVNGNIIFKFTVTWIFTLNIPLLIPNPHDFSFPSGHTLASFEAAIIIFLHNKKWGSLSLVLAALMAFSRMYLFVHFPTDIIGGIVLATIISIIVYYGYEKIKNRKKEEE